MEYSIILDYNGETETLRILTLAYNRSVVAWGWGELRKTGIFFYSPHFCCRRVLIMVLGDERDVTVFYVTCCTVYRKVNDTDLHLQ